MRMLVVLDLGAIEPETALAFDLQRRRIGAEIDGKSAAALLLAADRAVAELVGHRRVALDRNSTAPQRHEPLSNIGIGAFLCS